MQPLKSAVHSRGQSVLEFRKCLWPLYDCFGTPLNNRMAAMTSCEYELTGCHNNCWKGDLVKDTL